MNHINSPLALWAFFLLVLNGCIGYIVLFLLRFKRQITDTYVVLEIVPPENISQSPLATKELLTTLHNLALPTQTFFSFLLVQKRIYSLELIATKEEGIAYVLRIPTLDAINIKRNLYAYLPNIQINDIADHLLVTPNYSHMWWSFSEFTLSNHYCFPLTDQITLSEHDPMSYLASNMSKLQHGEYSIMQLVVSPITQQTHKAFVKKINQLLLHIANEYDILPLFKTHSVILSTLFIPFILLRFSIYFLLDALFLPVTLPLFLLSLGKTRLAPFLFPIKQNQQLLLTQDVKKTYQEIGNKLEQELFETSLRFFVISNEKETAYTRIQGLSTTLAPFNNATQSFVQKSSFLFLKTFFNTMNRFRLQYRLLSCMHNPVLSVDEIASLYHFPYLESMKIEGIRKIKSSIFPPSLELVNSTEQFNNTFAHNTYGNETSMIGLTTEERRRHMYVLGATGTGKTTLLKTMIQKDIQNGKGVCVIDPHGDLIEQILNQIPMTRLSDVILFDPSDIEYPIGLNLLELSQPSTNLEAEKDLIASHLVSVFAKLSPPRFWGPRMETILRITTLTALETQHPTLFTLQRILLDNTYRKTVVDTLSDPALLLFWKKEFVQLGSYQKAAVVAPITNKIGRLLTSPYAKYILAQKTSKLDCSDIMENGKILLCNLSKGKIGEDTSRLFGALLTTKIQLAALKRVQIPEENRRDFYLYIDEFQNFATPSFAEIMSEARKYRLNAILAHQTVAQIEDPTLIKVMLANTGTLVCFRTSSPLDQDFILPFFAPIVQIGDIANLPSYSFYMKNNALTPQDAFSGVTFISDTIENTTLSEDIISSSRKRYATSRNLIAHEIQKDFQSFFEQLETNKRKAELRKTAKEAKEKQRK